MPRLERSLLVGVVLVGALCVGDARAQPVAPHRLADTVACLERAAHETNLLVIQQQRLCLATPSPGAPVDCYLDASQGLLFTDMQSIALCRCTDSLEPTACVRRLRAEALLTDPEMLALCSPSIVHAMGADCLSRR